MGLLTRSGVVVLALYLSPTFECTPSRLTALQLPHSTQPQPASQPACQPASLSACQPARLPAHSQLAL